MDKNQLAEERTEWAEERTIWADQRTFLAQQRTFGGWIRTGLTSIAVGFGFIEVLGRQNPHWLVTATGLILIILGGVIPVMALDGYGKVQTQMKKTNRPKSSFPYIWIKFVAFALLAAAIGGILIVFI